MSPRARTPGELTNIAGRDHYQYAFSGLFAGGGIEPGQVIGETDEQGARIVDPGWGQNRSIYMEDIATTIYRNGHRLDEEDRGHTLRARLLLHRDLLADSVAGQSRDHGPVWMTRLLTYGQPPRRNVDLNRTPQPPRGWVGLYVNAAPVGWI